MDFRNAIFHDVTGTTPRVGHHETDLLVTQIDETLRLLRFSAPGFVIAAGVLTFFFWPTPLRLVVIGLSVCIAVPATMAMTMAFFLGTRIASTRSLIFAMRLAGLFAFLIGTAWGMVPVALLGPSDADHKLVVIATVTGVFSIIFALGPIAVIGMLFGVPIFIGSLVALSLQDAPFAVPLSILLTVYGIWIILSRRLIDKLALQRMADRVRIDEQNDTIGLLMRDTEGAGSDWLFELDAAGRLHGVSDRLALAANIPTDQLEGASFKPDLHKSCRRSFHRRRDQGCARRYREAAGLS